MAAALNAPRGTLNSALQATVQERQPVHRLKSTIKPQRGAFPLAAKAILAGTALAAPVRAIAPAPLSTWRLVKDFLSLMLTSFAH
jgi:hypothetical protein